MNNNFSLADFIGFILGLICAYLFFDFPSLSVYTAYSALSFFIFYHGLNLITHKACLYLIKDKCANLKDYIALKHIVSVVLPLIIYYKLLRSKKDK